MIRNHHSNSHMPRTSTRQELLHVVDQAAYALAQSKYWNAVQDHEDSSSDFDTNFDTDDMDITPPSPLTSNLSSQFSNGSDDSDDDSDDITACYGRLQDTITALRDEVERARVLHKPNEPPHEPPSCTSLFIMRSTALIYFGRNCMLTLSFLMISLTRSLIITSFTTGPTILSFPSPSSSPSSSIMLVTMAM